MNKKDVIDYIRTYVDILEVHSAVDKMYLKREPLQSVSCILYDEIASILDEYCRENDLPTDCWADFIDIEDIVFEL